MRIVFIRLANFVGVRAAMKLTDVEFDFASVDKPIIQIYGHNRCGKTVLIQQLHPFSSINLNGDERSDLALIIPNETGIKNIVYEINGEVYNITHTYTPTRNGHTVSSSLMHEGKELNPSGGVTTFNALIERIFGINKYVFQFIINGTQLMSFGTMSVTQRKNLLNKAMGIDIYDKIHKLATEDYRYTNKLITSLNNTKEFLLQTYGSYENLCTLLSFKQNEVNDLESSITAMKSRIDTLSGQIAVIREQNVDVELMQVRNQLVAYKNVVDSIGEFDASSYDKLVEEQLSLTNTLASVKNERSMVLRDIDDLYKKKEDIENTLMTSKRISSDYNNMVQMRDELRQKIDNIHVEEFTNASSSYLRNMMSQAQAINSMCKDISTCLNKELLNMLADMIEQGIDVSAFIVREGSSLMDSEKEKSTISQIRSMINAVEGEIHEECKHPDCLYWRTYEVLQTYFKSYQTKSNSNLTQYDIEQFDHAYKCVQTIQRLTRAEISDDLKNMFRIDVIIRNVANGQYGIDVDRIQYLMEEAAKIETKNQFIIQLNDIEKSIENMKALLLPTDNMDDVLKELQNKIDQSKVKSQDLTTEIDRLSSLISSNDRNRVMLSQVQHINVTELTKREEKLSSLANTMMNSQAELDILIGQYNENSNRLNLLRSELKTLSDAHAQYNSTVLEIDKHQAEDAKYKIIAEATSSTKGKPVIAIRDKVEDALYLTNRLLEVMYDQEIQMLKPEIDETTFSLPFRCGNNISNDIRYGSQSESTLLSLALSLSLASSLTQYNVPLVDEIDAYLDGFMRDSFLMMLQEIMLTLKMEQMFLISHNIQPESFNNKQYEHLVHVVNISSD